MTRPVVMQCIYSLERGGAQQVVVDLVTHLDRARFQPKVCSITDVAPRKGELEALDVPTFVQGKRPGSLFSGLATVFHLARFFRRERVAILHTHGFAGNVWSRLAGVLAGVPVLIHTDHNVEIKRRRVLALERFLLGRTHAVTAISEEATRNFLRNTGARPDKVRTIRNGFDLSRMEPCRAGPPPADLPIDPGRRTVVLIGRLVEIKGHRFLLEAAAQICRQRHDVQFLLVGDGPLRGFLEQLVQEKGLEEFVRFAGVRSDVPAFLRHMDAFVLPSLTEGLPITLLEAIASDLPVVASRVGGIPEVLEHGVTGLLVSPGNVDELRDAILAVLDSPEEAASRCRAAAERVRTEFDILQMVHAYENLYQEFLSS
jgi:glycosyltransferase involved in cell wall biosynthesis